MLAGSEVARHSSDSLYGIYAYTAREWDPEANLYYYRARYYDPKIARFISEDPLGFDGGSPDFYAYVGNNPGNYTDPSGLLSGGEVGIVTATAIAIATLPVSTPVVVVAVVAAAVGGAAKGYADYQQETAAAAERRAVNPTTKRRPSRRKQNDPVAYEEFDAGRDCNGNCNPCPPGPAWPSPGNRHGATSGWHWTWIEWHQTPDCRCIPIRRSGPTRPSWARP